MTFSIGQDSTKCIPIRQYVHIMQFAEIGLVCDTLMKEKNIQLSISYELIEEQKTVISDQDDKRKNLIWGIRALAVAVLIEGILIIKLIP